MSGQAFSFSLEPQTASIQQGEQARQEVQRIDLPQPVVPSSESLWIALGGLVATIALSITHGFTQADTSPNISLIIHTISTAIGVGVAWMSLAPLYSSLRAKLGEFSVDADSACGIGVAALGISAVTFLFEEHTEVLYWSPAETFCAVASLLGIGFWLKNRLELWLYSNCEDRASARGVVTVLEGTLTLTEIPTPSEKLETGTIIRVRSGERIYADSVILEGLVEVEERRLSGSSIFKIRGKGDTLFAGSTVTQGKADCKVQNAPGESFITTFNGAISKGLAGVHALQVGRNTVEKRGAGLLLFVAVIAAVFWFGTGKGVSFSMYILGGTTCLAALLWSYQWIGLFYRHLLFSAFNRGIVFEDFLPSIERLSSVDVCAIDYHSLDRMGETRITLFELLDERLDSKALKSVLASILSRSSVDEHVLMAQFIKEDIGSISLHEIDTLQIVEDPSSVLKGIIATVQGVPFVMGSEELLVTSGVQILASEVTPDEEGETESFFIAMNGEIVARILRRDSFASDGADLVEDLSEQQIRVVLLGEESSEIVQPAAASINLDLSDTFSAMSGGNRAEKVKGLSPVALIANSETPNEVIAAADSVFGFFDEYHWRSHAGDITLVSRSLVGVPWLFNAAYRLHAMVEFQTRFIIGLSALTVVAMVTGYLDPAIGMIISLLGAGYLFFKRR